MPFSRNSENVLLEWSRLSFPKLWEPAPVIVKGRQVGDPRFSALIVLTPQAVEKVREVEARLVKISWPEGVPPGVQIKSCLRYGDTHRPEDANLKGKYFLSANSTPKYPKHTQDPNDPSVKAAIEAARPRVYIRDPQGNLVESLNRSLIYSGCEVHARVGIFTTQLNASEPQVDCGLNQVLLTGRQLPGFGGMETADQAFGGLDDAPPPPEVEGASAMPPVYPSGTGAQTAQRELTPEEEELAAMGLL